MNISSQKVQNSIKEAKEHKYRILSIVQDFKDLAEATGVDIDELGCNTKQDFTKGIIDLYINEDNLKEESKPDDAKIEVSICKKTGQVTILNHNGHALYKKDMDYKEKDYDHSDQLAFVANRLSMKGKDIIHDVQLQETEKAIDAELDRQAKVKSIAKSFNELAEKYAGLTIEEKHTNNKTDFSRGCIEFRTNIPSTYDDSEKVTISIDKTNSKILIQDGDRILCHPKDATTKTSSFCEKPLEYVGMAAAERGVIAISPK